MTLKRFAAYYLLCTVSLLVLLTPLAIPRGILLAASVRVAQDAKDAKTAELTKNKDVADALAQVKAAIKAAQDETAAAKAEAAKAKADLEAAKAPGPIKK